METTAAPQRNEIAAARDAVRAAQVTYDVAISAVCAAQATYDQATTNANTNKGGHAS